jgi:hypothetical protein
MPRGTQLPHDKNVERSMQVTRDFEPDGHTTARQSQDGKVFTGKVHVQVLRENDSRMMPICEACRHVWMNVHDHCRPVLVGTFQRCTGR